VRKPQRHEKSHSNKSSNGWKVKLFVTTGNKICCPNHGGSLRI